MRGCLRRLELPTACRFRLALREELPAALRPLAGALRGDRLALPPRAAAAVPPAFPAFRLLEPVPESLLPCVAAPAAVDMALPAACPARLGPRKRAATGTATTPAANAAAGARAFCTGFGACSTALLPTPTVLLMRPPKKPAEPAAPTFAAVDGLARSPALSLSPDATRTPLTVLLNVSVTTDAGLSTLPRVFFVNSDVTGVTLATRSNADFSLTMNRVRGWRRLTLPSPALLPSSPCRTGPALAAAGGPNRPGTFWRPPAALPAR